MKSYNYLHKDGAFVHTYNTQEYQEIRECSSVLIQVFCGESQETFASVLHKLHQDFPHARIIASSTDGEIYNSDVLTRTTVISITLFEQTTLQTAYIPQQDDFAMGVALAKELVCEDTKVLISFADGLLCNGEEFLKGVYSVAPHIKVAGGLSGDNAEFQECFIGHDEHLYKRGAVGVALNSQVLHVESLYKFGWTRLGVSHTITKAKHNRVYTIDDMDAVSFYEKYLGKEIANELPATGIEFPLIIKKGDLEIARAATVRHEDGSLSFAGNVNENAEVFIGVGEIDKILTSTVDKQQMAVESFFIYSCMARRRFIPHLIHKEVVPFAKIAPTAGFFTYGEFYTAQEPELLNQTLTALAMSESSEVSQLICNNELPPITDERDKTLNALMNVINITTKELHEETKKVDAIKQELQAKNNALSLIQEMGNIGSWELDLRTGAITWSKESYKIHNIDPSQQPPSYDEFVRWILPESRKGIVSLEDVKAIFSDNAVHSTEIRLKRNDGKIMTLIETGKVLFENGEAVKVVGTTLDITELRSKDAMLSQQAKLAQMGEMINMIAHQWRQPLNAISAAAIKLSMQYEMGVLDEAMMQKTTGFIEEMTQVMSQTINDFIDFTKPTTKKELVVLENLLHDIMNIMGIQLQNHNIELRSDIEENLSMITYKKELEHVLINIISNARDALDEQETLDEKFIHLQAYENESGEVVIRVSDNAGGIDESIIERVFEPYFTTKETDKGTGLGLYMSRKIVSEHLNGTLEAHNIDNGVCFTLTMRCEDV